MNININLSSREQQILEQKVQDALRIIQQERSMLPSEDREALDDAPLYNIRVEEATEVVTEGAPSNPPTKKRVEVNETTPKGKPDEKAKS